MKEKTNLHAVGAKVGGAIALWFIFALVMGATGQYVSGPNNPPLLLGLTLLLPILLFLLAYGRSRALRDFSRSLDLRLITGVHLWRIGAIDFLWRYTQGNLPGGFALPAGIGDIVTGLGAIPLVLVLPKRTVAVRNWFIAWNIFGLLDLIVAVGSGILHSQSSFGILAGSGPTTLLMSEFPRSMVPTFFVPLFILLHLLALHRSKEVAVSTESMGGMPGVSPAHP